MMRRCEKLPPVPVEQLAAIGLPGQVEWWRQWSLTVIADNATCARRVDMWQGWWSVGGK